MLRYAIDALDRCTKEKNNPAALEQNLKLFFYLLIHTRDGYRSSVLITSDEQGGT